MKIRTSEETAVLLATMMVRADMTRARISDKTIRIVSGRKRLEGSFRLSLNADLAEYGCVLVPLTSGGHAMVRVSALEAAKPLTTAKGLQPQEISSLRKGHLDIDRLRDELGDDLEDDDED